MYISKYIVYVTVFVTGITGFGKRVLNAQLQNTDTKLNAVYVSGECIEQVLPRISPPLQSNSFGALFNG